MAGVIRAFCEDRGITLMAVSVDGKISDQLPQSRPDSGQAEQMRATHFPATFWSIRKRTSGSLLHGDL